MKEPWPRWLPEWAYRLPKPLRRVVKLWYDLLDLHEHGVEERRIARARKSSGK